MASLRQLIAERCAGYAALYARIVRRCYPDKVPESPTYPLIVYHAPIAANDTAYRAHNHSTGRTEATVQFDCYAETGDEAEALANDLKAAWNGYSNGCSIGYSFIANDITSPEDALNKFRYIVDVIIEYQR